jgi:LacI family transcriptional regulator
LTTREYGILFNGNVTSIVIPGGGEMSTINIKDVAKEAGVAVSTVSRVINGHPDVKKETKEHILNVIEKLNYIPNNSARTLKRNTTKNIGVFILGDFNPFFSQIVEEIEDEVSKNGFSFIIHYHHNEVESLQSVVSFILDNKLAGLIYLGGSLTKDSEIYLKTTKIPLVFISTVIEENMNKKLFSSVTINEKNAVSKIANHLLDQGHKKIGVISARKEVHCVAKERFSAFSDILEINGIYLGDDVEIGNYTLESGYEALNKLMDKNPELTCIFALNDLMAIGACRAISDRGLKIPEDISVVGFDGLEYGQYLQPKINNSKTTL